MKPRLRLRRGVWCCSRLDPRTRMALPPLAHGYTPHDAWHEWTVMQREAAT